MQDLDKQNIDLVDGGGPLAGAAATAGVIATGAGMAAMIPGPSTLAFGFVAGAMGLLSIGLGAADSYFGR